MDETEEVRAGAGVAAFANVAGGLGGCAPTEVVVAPLRFRPVATDPAAAVPEVPVGPRAMVLDGRGRVDIEGAAAVVFGEAVGLKVSFFVIVEDEGARDCRFTAVVEVVGAADLEAVVVLVGIEVAVAVRGTDVEGAKDGRGPDDVGFFTGAGVGAVPLVRVAVDAAAPGLALEDAGAAIVLVSVVSFCFVLSGAGVG